VAITAALNAGTFKPAAASCVDGKPALKASNGNVDTCEEYKNRLFIAVPAIPIAPAKMQPKADIHVDAGPLITELHKAKREANEYIYKFIKPLRESKVTVNENMANLEADIQRVEKRTSANPRSASDTINDAAGAAPAITGATPGTGTQAYYSASFVGSALFATNDVSVFNVRVGDSDEFRSSQLIWDVRLPIGRKLRLNPRVGVAVWEGASTGVRRQTVTPSLRLLLNTSRYYRLEIEAGANAVTRTDARGEQKATGRFVNLGYRADF
jgi:hypothetical protein